MLVCVCCSVVLWLIKSCRSMDSEMGRAWENTSRGWARHCQWRKPASVGARLLLETQRKRVRSYTHTHSQTHSKYVQTHTSQVQNKHPLDLLFFSVSCLFSTPCFVICTTMLHNPFECVYVSASGSSQNVDVPLGSNSGLTIYFLFPISVIYLLYIFFHLDHPHMPYLSLETGNVFVSIMSVMQTVATVTSLTWANRY